MSRASLIVAVAIFASCASADPNIPQIAQSATAYRQSIESNSGTKLSAAQLLRSIKTVDATNHAQAIRLYEQLVALNTSNFRSWFQLGQSWRAADPTAENGIAAAFLAYGVARSAPDRLEALLLLSSFLRARLEKYRNEYEAARTAVLNAETKLQYLKNAEQNNDVLPSDPNDPAGNIQLLSQTREIAAHNSEQALNEIASIAAALDEIYSEAATKAPGLDPERLKSGDSRSAVFLPVLNLKTDTPKLTFRFENSDVRPCIEFTQELRSNDLSYRAFVDVHLSDVQVEFGVIANGRFLCLTGLKPGAEDYRIDLMAGLPSKQGAKLADSISLDAITLPDLPERIGFPGRQFILPRSGPGELPLSITNVKNANLEIFKITDRTLYRHIALGYIGGELPGEDYDDLRSHFAELHWGGKVDFSIVASRKNEPVRVFLPVRSILDERREWLRAEIQRGGNQRDEIFSAKLRPRGVTDERLGVEGRFYAGPTRFEQASLDVASPGIYALVTPDQSKSTATNVKYLVQWFANTDISLSFYEGERNFTVVARSLTSGKAKARARIELISASNRVLASGPTDDNGVISFSRNLTRGTQSNTLVAIFAQNDDDFGFITYGAERLDLSRLNIDGRTLKSGFNGFLVTERGIYEPGEKMNVLSIIRNTDGFAPEPGPRATLRVTTRDRTVVQKQIKSWTLGGANTEILLPKNIRPGTARIALSLGDRDDEPVIGETLVQVGTVRPDRARLNFVDVERAWKAQKVSPNFIEIVGRLNAQYLFATEGRTQGIGRDLKVELIAKVAPTESPVRGCYENFVFGDTDDKLTPVATRQFLQYTDANGNLDFRLSGIPLLGVKRPMAATVEATIFDASGPLASRSQPFPIVDDGGWVGISKIPAIRLNGSGTFDIGVDLVLATDDNKSDGDKRLDYTLARERDLYVWERRDESWQPVKSVNQIVVGQGPISTAALKRIPTSRPAQNSTGCIAALEIPQLASNIEMGRYLLTIRDRQSGRMSSVRFYVGSAATDPGQLEPNIFTLTSTKASYESGEPIELTAEAPFDGEVLVAIADGDIRRWATGQAKDGVAKIKIYATPDWAGKGLYALATVFRSGAGGDFVTGPGRAIGAVYFEVKGPQKGYTVSIRPADSTIIKGYVSPDEPLSFDVCANAASSAACTGDFPADAYVMVYIVDEGLLSLTGYYETNVDPKNYFYGRQRFGLRIMDNYSRLVLKDGGDRPTRLALSNYTSPQIVSMSRGPEKLVDGRKSFTIPKVGLTAGSVSIFAVVWSQEYASAASIKVAVRSEVVADLHTPEFLLSGDQVILPLNLENLSFRHEGTYAVRVSSLGSARSISIVDSIEPQSPNNRLTELRVGLRRGDPKIVYVLVDTSPGVTGLLKLRITLEAIGSPVALTDSSREWQLDIRPTNLPSIETVSFPLRQESIRLKNLVSRIVENYAQESVKLKAWFSDDSQSLLAASSMSTGTAAVPLLDQLIWRGQILLYGTSSATSATQNGEIERILTEIQSLQQANGSFIPYRTVGGLSGYELSVSDKDGVFRSANALDFMYAAKKMGYDVSATALSLAQKYIERRLSDLQAKSDSEIVCSLEVAYAALVLIDVGSDTNLIASFQKCPDAERDIQATKAAVFAKYGLSDDAKVILASFGDSKDVSWLNELNSFQRAMTYYFLVEAGASPALKGAIAEFLLTSPKGKPLSEGAAAWVLRAGGGTPSATFVGLKPSDLRITGTGLGVLRQGSDGVVESETVEYKNLDEVGISISEANTRSIRGFISLEGLRTTLDTSRQLPEGALRRRFYDSDSGREIDPEKESFKIGARVIVVLEGKREAVEAIVGPGDNPSLRDGPLLVVDHLPSTFSVISKSVALGQHNIPGSFSQLNALGDIRSVDSDLDRWIALIIPESWRKNGNELEEEPDAKIAGDAAQAKIPSDADSAKTKDTDQPEFRQAYLVRVNAGGRFAVPGASIEATIPPISTLWSEQMNIKVDVTGNTKR
jgi:uncharacterized protein YfaS (alpha-2-macroglobulin family)